MLPGKINKILMYLQLARKKHAQNNFATVGISVDITCGQTFALSVGSVGFHFLGFVPAFLGNVCLYYHETEF